MEIKLEKITLSSNLIVAINNYLYTRPFGEVANIALALQQEVQAQATTEEDVKTDK